MFILAYIAHLPESNLRAKPDTNKVGKLIPFLGPKITSSLSQLKPKLIFQELVLFREDLDIHTIGPRLQSPTFIVLMITKHMWLFI